MLPGACRFPYRDMQESSACGGEPPRGLSINLNKSGPGLTALALLVRLPWALVLEGHRRDMHQATIWTG